MVRVWNYGDDVNTDLLFPGKYTYSCSTLEEIKPHLLEDLDPTFHSEVQKGDVLLVGKNFGCGSSREHGTLGLKGVGVQAIIGISFARIFYRSAINQGLILIECPQAVQAYKPGDAFEFDLEGGIIKVGGKEFSFPKLPPQILAIRDAGGLLKFAERKLEEREKAKAK